MARAGIYKSEVRRARDNLIAQGRHPSIDAVRIELGNTGSKATIHRYLKELEEEDGGKSGPMVAVSDTLQSVVERLAEQLHEEADKRIDAASKSMALERQEGAALLKSRDDEILTLRARLEDATARIATEKKRRLDVEQLLYNESLARAQLHQQVIDLQEQLEAEGRNRQSLEEKFQDARKALEHFREASKEQLVQERRQHEQQVQFLQSELRTANLAVTDQQHKVAEANQELARLSSELAHLKQELHLSSKRDRELISTKKLLADADARLKELELSVATAEAGRKQLLDDCRISKERADSLGARTNELELLLATTQARSDAQAQLVEQFNNQVSQLLASIASSAKPVSTGV